MIVELELGSVQIVNIPFLGFIFLVLTILMILSDLWEMGILSSRVCEMQEM